jgi:hypothetical protein
MPKLIPFADDAASVSIDKLTVENGTDRIAIFGSLDITRDKQGLAHAQALKVLLDEAVQRLETEKDLPDRVPGPSAPKVVRNPFA